jgi:hypothetical protein
MHAEEASTAPAQLGSYTDFAPASEYGSPTSRPGSPNDDFLDAGEHPAGGAAGMDQAGGVQPRADFSRDAATALGGRSLGRRDSTAGGPASDPPRPDDDPQGGAQSLTRRLSTLGKAGVQLHANAAAAGDSTAGGDATASHAGLASNAGRPVGPPTSTGNSGLPPSPFTAQTPASQAEPLVEPARLRGGAASKGPAALPLSPFAAPMGRTDSNGDSAYDASGGAAAPADPPGGATAWRMPSKSPFELIAEVGWNPPAPKVPEPVFHPKYQSCPAAKVVTFGSSESCAGPGMKRQSSLEAERPCEGLDEPRLKESAYSQCATVCMLLRCLSTIAGGWSLDENDYVFLCVNYWRAV